MVSERKDEVGMKLVDALMLFGCALLVAGVASIILFDISGLDTDMVRFDAIVAASAIGMLISI
jgi:hypothetical protein